MDSSRFFKTFLITLALLTANLHATIRVGLVTSSDYVGDREVAWRIKITGEKLGWKVYIDEKEGVELQHKKLDWVICMLPDHKLFHASCPNYLMVFHPFFYLDSERKFNSHYLKYDGYLLTINDRKTLKAGLKKKNKDFHHVHFYPTIYSIPYKKLSLNNLVVMIPVWGNRLADPKFGELYQLLNQSGFAKFYGVNKNKNVDPQNYMGSIPFDGVSVIKTLQQHGIVLVFHSDIHNQESIPSARIFEAAAASTVIISDENPFVKKHFGDSVFYIDTTQSGENIFKQIQGHISTIFNDPKKALKMAKKAHEIFEKEFTMERQLLNLLDMHKKVPLKKKYKSKKKNYHRGHRGHRKEN